MLFYVKYQVDRDKQADTQAFFANMSEEERAKEAPDGVNLIGRWHDLPNGWGVAIVEAESQEALTAWTMSWSGACTFPVITPVVDDDTGTKLLKQMQGWMGFKPNFVSYLQTLSFTRIHGDRNRVPARFP